MHNDVHNISAPARALPLAAGAAPAPDRVVPTSSLKRNFAWALAGNLFYAACQWSILIILAKLGSAEMVGRFSLGLAITAPIMLLANLQLRSIQVTDTREEYRFGEYFTLRMLTTAAAMFLIAGICLSGWYRIETAVVIMAVGAFKAAESLSDVVYGRLQLNERMDRLALLQMVRGACSVAAVIIIMYATGSLMWAALGIAASWGVLFLTVDLPVGARVLREGASSGFELARDPRRLQRLIRLALPMGVVMMLISLNTAIPRYYVEHYVGEGELGVFAAMSYFTVIGAQAATALGQSATPRLSRYFANADTWSFYRSLIQLAACGLLMGGIGVAIALVAGRPILTLFFGPEYAESHGIFVIVMVAGGILWIAVLLGYGLSATRAFHRCVVPYFVVTVVALGCSHLLIPRYGLAGAAWTSVIISTAMCLSPLSILATTKP